MATVRLDMIGPARARVNQDYIELVRGARVSNIDIAAGTSDPAVLIKAIEDAAIPSLYDSYPDPTGRYSSATLYGYEAKSVPARNVIDIDLTYRQPQLPSGGSSAWSVSENSSTVQVPTYSTADDSQAIKVFYKPGAAPAIGPGPPGAVDKVAKGHTFRPRGTITATTALKASDWYTFRAALKAHRCKINSVPWGGYGRGQVLFVGPQASTTDYGRTFRVQVDFLTDPFGFFIIGAWFDDHGGHPTDCDTEAVLRGQGLPLVNGILQANGITIASVQGEVDFGSLFVFGGLLGT